ncbi:MAG: AAA family ATPase [Propionibacteriales bacterium]|nr:AAA family ATPase [Propionibacteriales bacterium]
MTTSGSHWEQAALRRASTIAKEFGQAQVDNGHLALALLELFPHVTHGWETHGVTADEVRLGLRRDLTPSRNLRGHDFTVAPPAGKVVISRSVSEALQHIGPDITTGADIDHAEVASLSKLVVGLLPERYRALLNSNGVRHGDSRPATGERRPRVGTSRTRPASIDTFMMDLTEAARAGGLDPLIGREHELHQVIRVLCRKKKRNPVLVGEPGVGKTAILEGLASRIATDRVPAPLVDAQVVAISLPSMLEGTRYRGEFEGRAQALLSAALDAEHPLVMFVDEIHLMVHAGAAEGGLDLASMMLGAMARGEVAVVGASTREDLRRSLHAAGPLARRLQPVQVDEPAAADTLAILAGLRPSYEIFHGVTIDENALTAAVESGRRRHALAGHQPDLALEVLDDACAEARLRRCERADPTPPVVRAAHVDEVVADRSAADRLTRGRWRDVRPVWWAGKRWRRTRRRQD